MPRGSGGTSRALSSYARQFLAPLQKPKVEHISGLSPAVSIEQKTTSKSPRSTVGTVTEIHDYLRILFARLGQPHCPACGTAIGTQTADEIVEKILHLPEGSKVYVMAPVDRRDNEDYAALWDDLRQSGFSRVRVDGVSQSLDSPPELSHRRKHRVEVVIDRAVVRRKTRSRLADSVESALDLGKGVVHVARVGDEADEARWPVERYSQHRSCDGCGRSFEELVAAPLLLQRPDRLVPRLRRARDPARRQPRRADPRRPPVPERGRGRRLADLRRQSRLRPDDRGDGEGPRRSTSIAPSTTSKAATAARSSTAPATPGSPSRRRRASPSSRSSTRGCSPRSRRPPGSRSCIATSSRGWSTTSLRLLHGGPAPRRLRRRPVPRLHHRSGRQLAARPALAFFKGLDLKGDEKHIAGDLVREIRDRLQFLVDVGLDYLSLARGTPTLSGGESQRIRLASQVGSGLTGVLYVLDEPTIGLHPRDNARLLGALRRLRDLGNTLVLVEHDREVIEAADHLIDFGPGSGDLGGEVTAAGPPSKVKKIEGFADRRLPLGSARHPRSPPTAAPAGGPAITIRGARHHNLKNVDASFPIGLVTVIDRRQRLGQEFAGRGHPLEGRREEAPPGPADPGRARLDRGAGAGRQGHQRRPGPRSGARRPRPPSPIPAPST